ncbi:MAG: stress response translation initiation inhibitor YciH [Chloroflexi bacterium]|nr:stress response translation initiation inhibitor YciH [Chloroflexota bacterium]
MGRGPNSGDSRLVYSTDGGRGRPPLTPHNRKPPGAPPAAGKPAAPDDGVVRIMRDRKGRGGKTATAITGLPGTEPELDAVLKKLKQQCAAGGSREGRTLLIQGDHRDALLATLTALGHKARLAGG